MDLLDVDVIERVKSELDSFIEKRARERTARSGTLTTVTCRRSTRTSQIATGRGRRPYIDGRSLNGHRQKEVVSRWSLLGSRGGSSRCRQMVKDGETDPPLESVNLDT